MHWCRSLWTLSWRVNLRLYGFKSLKQIPCTCDCHFFQSFFHFCGFVVHPKDTMQYYHSFDLILFVHLLGGCYNPCWSTKFCYFSVRIDWNRPLWHCWRFRGVTFVASERFDSGVDFRSSWRDTIKDAYYIYSFQVAPWNKSCWHIFYSFPP